MLDNRKRDKAKELEEVENEDDPIDEEQATKELQEEQHKAPDDLEEELVEEEEEPVDEKELDEAEKEVEEEEEKKPVIEKEKVKPELEERYKESTREAQLLSERNRQLTDAIVKIDDIKPPTEEELIDSARADGLDWEELTAAEKLLVKKTYIADRKLAAVQSAVKDVQNIDQWADKVDAFIDENDSKQTYKALSGKEQQFRAFAMKQSHRGIELPILISHFLMTAEPTAHKKGSMFLTPSTGLAPEKKKTVVDDADSSATLRQSNQREWQRQLKAGKIKIEV